MKIARLAGLVFVAVVVMGLVGASFASASEPLFVPANGKFGELVVGTSGLSILFANNGTILAHCEKDVFHGVLSSSLLIGNATVHYLGCVSATSPFGTTCPLNVGGLILTKNLHGILGLILPSRETGILFLPTSGKVFAEFEKNECTEETSVSGSIAGLITPTGKSQTTGKVIFAANGNTESILDIDLTHGLGLVAPKLTAFTTAATLTQEELVEFSGATEVT